MQASPLRSLSPSSRSIAYGSTNPDTRFRLQSTIVRKSYGNREAEHATTTRHPPDVGRAESCSRLDDARFRGLDDNCRRDAGNAGAAERPYGVSATASSKRARDSMRIVRCRLPTGRAVGWRSCKKAAKQSRSARASAGPGVSRPSTPCFMDLRRGCPAQEPAPAKRGPGMTPNDGWPVEPEHDSRG